MDKEVVQLLRDSHARVTKLLTKHVGDLHTLSKDLLAKETLTGLEIQQLLGLAPTPPAAPERRKKTNAPAPSVPEAVESADADGERDGRRRAGHHPRGGTRRSRGRVEGGGVKTSACL